MSRVSTTKNLSVLTLISLASITLQLPAEARSQWEIMQQNQSNPYIQGNPNAPGTPIQPGGLAPATAPGQQTLPLPDPSGFMPIPAGLHNNMPPQLGANFWKGQAPGGITNRVSPGVVLTGILEHTISSGKSLPGDTFAITLEDGFVQQGMQVIPQHSKIVGVVTSVSPAKKQRHGHPGQMQVSLQSLVLPDGNHLPFAGFIDSNPAHAFKKPHKKRYAGFDIGQTGNNISGMFGQFTDGIGFTVARRHRGNEFILEEGEAIPVRLNKTLTVPPEVLRPVQTAAVPGQIPSPTSFVPGSGIPGAVPPQPVPGLVGDDVFAAPVGPAPKSLSDMPEPF